MAMKLALGRMLPLVLVPALLLAGCGEEDAASVKIKLNGDLSGTINTSTVSIPASSPVEGATKGSTWNNRGQIVMASGTFANISNLQVADITFECKGPEPIFMRVSLPRGPQAKWPGVLGVTDETARQTAAKALVPESKNSQIGAVTSIRIKLPAGFKVIGSAVSGAGRGLSASMEDDTAIITVPVAAAMTAGEPLVWHITSEKISAKKAP